MRMYPNEEILVKDDDWYLILFKGHSNLLSPYNVHDCNPDDKEALGGGYQSTKTPTCHVCGCPCPERLVTLERIFNL